MMRRNPSGGLQGKYIDGGNDPYRTFIEKKMEFGSFVEKKRMVKMKGGHEDGCG
jgi:hypothetical protein